MKDTLLSLSFLASLFMLMILWSHLAQQPIVLLKEDNLYRASDCIYIPVPGVYCEPTH